MAFDPTYSSDQIWVGEDMDVCLTDELNDVKSDVENLHTNKADVNHVHTQYAALEHTHPEYAAASDMSQVQSQVANKVDKVDGKSLSSNDYTDTEKNKLSNIESGAQKNKVTGIKGNAESTYRTGNINITPANIGAAASSHTHTKSQITGLIEPSDYVIASGSSGEWTYRKWNSGIYECWRQISGTITHTVTWNNFYLFNGTAEWPSGVFKANPTVFYNCYIGSGYAIAARGGLSTTTRFNWAALGTDGDSNVGYCIYVYAIGQWK